MFSHENNPPDPLKSIGKSTVQHNISDENNTGDNPLPEGEHQLIASSVDVHNFSIRDFVLAARSKDIGTNWPFPDKHLKLCLKHGVKNLLPPFQSKTSKRKQLSTIRLEKTSLVENEIITSSPDEVPSARVDGLTVDSLNDAALTQKITTDHLDINLDKSDKDSDFPSSVTTNSKAYPSRSGGSFKHHKVSRIVARNSTKKCKLIVKFGSPSVHSSNEETMPHKTNLSESLASKVCPVCKTFSSSSNTTLNAHIDQCLSLEATSEGMSDSKIGTKCKVKPRKMRSMVDIYEVALVCTIEDLDRRNGSSWATDLSFPARKSGLSSLQGNKKQITSAAESDREHNIDGGVYIDASGRKVRILSKMDSFPSMIVKNVDHGSKMPQMSKILVNSKKKHRRTKYHRLAGSNKKLLPSTANLSEVSRSQKPSSDTLLSKDKSHFQIKCSRETDEPETIRDKCTYQRSGHKLRDVQHSTVKSQKSRLGGFGVDNSCSRAVSMSSTCLSENHKKMKSWDDIHISTNLCSGVKRSGLSMSKDDRNFNTDTNGHKRPKNTTECINESTYVGKNSTWKPLKQLNRPEKETDEDLLSPVQKHQPLQKTAKLRRNNTTSLNQLSVHGPEIWKKTICSTNKEYLMQIETEEEEDEEDEDEYEDADEDLPTWQSESLVRHDSVLERTGNQPGTDESRLNETWQDRSTMRQLLKEVSLNVSVNTSDEFVDNLGVPPSNIKVVEHGQSDIRIDSMNLTAERTMGSFIRSMNTGIHERADSYVYPSASPEASKDSSTGGDSGPYPCDPVLDGGECNHSIMELESNAAPGNTCSDIDPIPIPGPPGSFLPSPGNAETEDYQGNSSLTASLISSHEQGDGNMSDSPNSAASSVSNLAAEMSDKVSGKFASPGIHAIPDSSLSGFLVPSPEISMDQTFVFPQAMKVGVSRSEFGEQKSFVKPQDNNQPCCCSRRERVSRGSIVDYQESQLLRRRNMSAVVLPTKKIISCSLNTAPSYPSAGSDIYSPSSSSSFRVEAILGLDTPAGFASPKYPDTANANKFHSNGDSESASPSAVLRLMGKNLMVAKNDEDRSGPGGDAATSDANMLMHSCKTASPIKAPNSGYFSQYQGAPRPPALISPSYSNMRHSFDFRMPNGPWGQINFPRPELTNHSQASVTRLHDMRTSRGMPAPLDHKWPIQPCLPKSGFDMLPDQMRKGVTAAIDFRRHVIIVDDDAESEVRALKNGATITNGLKGTGASIAAERDQSRLIYPVYPGLQPPLSSTPIYMQQGPRNTCFPVPFPGRSSVNPPQVNFSQNGSYVLQGGPFTASSPSVHPKPGLFYSPRLP